MAKGRPEQLRVTSCFCPKFVGLYAQRFGKSRDGSPLRTASPIEDIRNRWLTNAGVLRKLLLCYTLFYHQGAYPCGKTAFFRL